MWQCLPTLTLMRSSRALCEVLPSTSARSRDIKCCKRMHVGIHAGPMVVLVRALEGLTQLRRLTLALERPEAPFPDATAALTDAMVQSVQCMLSLTYIYIGNIPWGTVDDIRHVIRCALRGQPQTGTTPDRIWLLLS